MKISKILPFILFFFLFSLLDTFAVSGDVKSPVGSSLIEMVENTTKYIRPGIMILFLGVIVYGGVYRMTALANEEKQKNSMLILTGGIIGFVIVVLAPWIVSIMSSIFGIGGFF